MKQIVTILFLIVACTWAMQVHSQTLKERAESKIETLNGLIQDAEGKGIDATRERMTVHTAELFLDYADWDEENQTAVLTACQSNPIYKNQANAIAAALPDFERSETVNMLDVAIQNLTKAINGEIDRMPAPASNWKDISVQGNQLVDESGKPVYIAEYTFMPTGEERYNKYYGDFGGYHFDLVFLGQDEKLPAYKVDQLTADPGGTNIGGPFLGHGLSSWMKAKHPGIEVGSRLFTKYDIDNPEIRRYWEVTLAQIVPKLKGQTRTRLGYLLANEPHWHTAAKAWDTPVNKITTANANWDTGPVSDYTKAKFRTWLETKHKDIASLNSLWGTSYQKFSEADITVPVDNNLLGTPKWYDWMKFNQDRVTEWFNFLITTIKKDDPSAIANVKVMPKLWVENGRDHGLDFEAITELSGVIGNDAAANKRKAWAADEYWENDYVFNWFELCMGYDFFRSVSPNKPIYNSENHYTISTGYQDLYMKPEYARCVYWLSTLFGCNANTTWVWSRKDNNGALSINQNQCGTSHIGSVCVQPRILNEITLTMMDLNAHSEDISALQSLHMPIRIFYSETSALNKRTHMEGIRDIYEKLFFKGCPIGFATKNIIKNQDNKLWDVIVVYNTENVTTEELAALQSYLDNGGTVIVDAVSLRRDEYSRSHPSSLNLKPGNGKLITAALLSDMVNKAFQQVPASHMPPVTITETNIKNKNLCSWRSFADENGRKIISITNLGKVSSKVKFGISGVDGTVTCKDILTGKIVSNEYLMKPEEVLFLEIGTTTAVSKAKKSSDIQIYPTLFSDNIVVRGAKEKVSIYNAAGNKLAEYAAEPIMNLAVGDFLSGMYLVNVDNKYTQKVIKY